MYKCKICGATVSPTSTAVAAHYEKQHFSVFVKNGNDIRRLPKAFLREVTPGKPVAATAKAEESNGPQKHSGDPQKNRAKNMEWLGSRVKGIDRDHTFEYQEKKAFECPCCKRIVLNGKCLKHSREDYENICYDCFKAARKIIVTMPKPKV